MSTERNLIKTIVHGFQPKTYRTEFDNKDTIRILGYYQNTRILSERASQGEHNGENYSFVTPSREELKC